MAKVLIVMTKKEVQESIPYALICETREGSAWHTCRRKTRWLCDFTEAERNKASKLFRQARQWTLVKGVPETVRMSAETFELWQKLGAMCASL